MDVKRQFIRSLLISQVVLPDESPEEDIGYFTYFTNFGVIIGKKIDLSILKATTINALENEINKSIEDKVKIDLYQIAATITKIMLKESSHVENMDIKAIFLEDVYIKSINNERYNLATFVLFTDQITGLVPGKMQLN
ncbi:hypothetical protein MKZ26_03310 [Sporosarcina sp. FSL K6-6792]|uniref:hypothetical protein n=1 Tax=Sporosarcina sp. FSL K6-6792 TaxID=2921559 RepID=UPI0030F60D5B